QAAEKIPAEIASALEKTAEGGKIDCKALWTIAKQLGVGRKSLSAACEALGLKIRSCQLGTFCFVDRAVDGRRPHEGYPTGAS
ncbi:MAG: hypothetical protein AB1558_10330, partial [Thermodesulfobacteriota bacterium]